MTIGIVINSSWNIFNFRSGLIRHFLSEGHRVIAISPDDGYAEQLTKLGCTFCHADMDARGTNPLHDLRLVLRLYRLYKVHQLDVVLHYTPKPNIYGTLAAFLAKVPAINNVTGLGTLFLHDNLTSLIGKALYRFSFRYAKWVFFQNEDDRRLFINEKMVFPQLTGLIPGSGVNTDHFSPKSFERKPVFTFLMVSRLLLDKGLVEFVDAAKALKKKNIAAKFQLLGPHDATKLGVPLAKINEWEKDGFIEYLGATQDVRSYIEQADCVVLPSYREGTPRALLEAASQGKPLIATNVPGCREAVVHAYNGFLCHVKSSRDLADKMELMAAQSDAVLHQLGQNSRQLACMKFDEAIIIKHYQKAIAFCVGQIPAQEVVVHADAADLKPVNLVGKSVS